MGARGIVLGFVAALLVQCSTSGADNGDASTEASADAGSEIGPTCDSGNVIGAAMFPTTESVTVNGVARTYVFDVPQSAVDAMDAGCGAALVIGLHGAGDTAVNFLSATGLEETAKTSGFVLAGPQALDGAWVLAPPQWTSPDGKPTSLWNDIALVLQIIASTEAAYRIDPAQVFVAGLSRGGYFTGMLATASNNPKATGGPYSSPFAAYAILPAPIRTTARWTSRCRLRRITSG